MGLGTCYDLLLKPNWNESTAWQELYSKELLPPIYTSSHREIETPLGDGLVQRVKQVAWQVFSILCFPIYLSLKSRQIYHYFYQTGHELLGKVLFPAYLKNRNQVLRLIENWNINTFFIRNCYFYLSALPIVPLLRPPAAEGLSGAVLDTAFKQIGKRGKEEMEKWQPQRFTLTAKGKEIDAIFVGRRVVKESLVVEERSTVKTQEVPYSLSERLIKWISLKIWASASQIPQRVERALPPKIWEQTGLPQRVERVAQKVEEVRKGRVVLYCCGQEELAEWMWCDSNLLSLLEKTYSDLVVWNHPGLGSCGKLTRESVVETYREMLQFLEDPHGFGAKEIICCGPSLMGSAIALEALQNYTLKPGMGYALLLNRAPSTMYAAVSSISALLGWAVKFFGWDMNPIEALQKIKIPTLILQTARVDGYETLTDSSKLIPDGVIEDVDATLAKPLLDRGVLGATQKVVGVSRWHDEPLTLSQMEALTKDLEELLLT